MSSAPVTRTPRQTMSGSSVASKVFQLSDITNESKPLPGRYAMHAAPGWGKTSLLTYAQTPIFIETKGETGLESLIAARQVGRTPHFPELTSWGEMLGAINFLRMANHTFKTLVVDTLNGAERMMHEHVCERDFGGDWTDKGFMGFMRGYEVSLSEWRSFLQSLDELRREKGMSIFFLIHTRIKTFKNPTGADYDRYVPEMHEKTWAVTKGWLDHILFGNFEVVVKTGSKVADSTKKGKAAETSSRILYTNSNNPTFDAKNRLGLPDEIDMGDSAEEGWKAFSEAVAASRKGE